MLSLDVLVFSLSITSHSQEMENCPIDWYTSKKNINYE